MIYETEYQEWPIPAIAKNTPTVGKRLCGTVYNCFDETYTSILKKVTKVQKIKNYNNIFIVTTEDGITYQVTAVKK